MSTLIQIKRSANIAAPSTSVLEEGELAYSYDQSNNGANAKLYIEVLDSGSSPVIHTLGGKYYTDKIDNASSSTSANSLVLRDSLGSFSANVITAATFVGNVQGVIDGVANSAAKLQTARNITLAGDLEGNVYFDGTGDVTINANVKSNSVALGTDTTGDYVSNVLAGTGITVTGQGGETATPTVALTNTGVSAGHYGGATQIPTLVVDAQGRITSATNTSVSVSFTLAADSGAGDTINNGDVFRVSGGAGIDTSLTDNTITVALETSGVVANTYGSASKIPVITVDQYGRITSAANVAVAGVTNFSASGNTFTISTADGGSFSASIQENSVRLGTDTTGNYLANVVPGTGLTGSNFGTEGATPTISLASTAVTAGSYGGTTQIPTFVVDAQGRLTSAANVSISTDLSLVGDSGSDTLSLASETLAIKGGTGIGTSVASNAFTIVNTGVTSLAGTTNEITVSAANGSITVGLPDDVTITRDLNVLGNLNVTGNVITHSADNLIINDSLIQLANNNTSSDVVDIGFYGSYNTDGGEHEHAGLFRDASDGNFRLFQGLQGSGNLTTTVNISGNGYSIATLVANLTGGTVSGLSANITVGDGGTGRGTLTTNAILYGQGTSAVGLVTGTAYQVLQLNASGVPVFGGIDGGTY